MSSTSDFIKALLEAVNAPKQSNDQAKVEARIIMEALISAIAFGDTIKITEMVKTHTVGVSNVITAITASNDVPEVVLQWAAAQSWPLTRAQVVRLMLTDERQKIKYLLTPSGAAAYEYALVCAATRTDPGQLAWFVENIPPVYCYILESTRLLIVAGEPKPEGDPEMCARFNNSWAWPVDASRHASYVDPSAAKYVSGKINKLIQQHKAHQKEQAQ